MVIFLIRVLKINFIQIFKYVTYRICHCSFLWLTTHHRIKSFEEGMYLLTSRGKVLKNCFSLIYTINSQSNDVPINIK